MKKELIKYIMISLIVVVFGIFIYPGIYKYDKLDQRYPVRINRITGSTDVLVGTKWESVTENKTDQIKLLKEELDKNQELLKQQIISEIKEEVINQVKSEVLTEYNLLLSEIEKTRTEIEAYKKFQTDPNNYFTIGSTNEEVKSIMGTPTKIEEFFDGEIWWYYDFSVVRFRDNKVTGYSNVSNNLMVK